MAFIDSSISSGTWAAAGRGAAGAGLLAVAAGGALLLWGSGPGRAAAGGLGGAWLLSTGSLAALLGARPVSARAFWWAFWGGMGARLAFLAVLMAWCWRAPAVSSPALLLGYAAGVAVFLPLELRLVPVR